MSRDEIIVRVMQCMDEVYALNSGNYGLNYPIERFLDDAAVEVLRLAPLEAIDNRFDFSDSQAQNLGDGTGRVLLPQGFLRLACFKMEGWKKGVFESITPSDMRYFRQHNPITRGGVSKPVVVIDSGYLYYYSLADAAVHKIERAEAVLELKADEHYPKKLVDALCWMTAYKILLVINEPQCSANAKMQFQEVMGVLTNR